MDQYLLLALLQIRDTVRALHVMPSAIDRPYTRRRCPMCLPIRLVHRIVSNTSAFLQTIRQSRHTTLCKKQTSCSKSQCDSKCRIYSSTCEKKPRRHPATDRLLRWRHPSSSFESWRPARGTAHTKSASRTARPSTTHPSAGSSRAADRRYTEAHTPPPSFPQSRRRRGRAPHA